METFELILADDECGVTAISLVDSPALGYQFIAMNSHQHNFAVENEEKRIVFGVIMLADTPIFRNNPPYGEHFVVFTKETVRGIVERYFKGKLNDSVTVGHMANVEGVYLHENYTIDRENGINPPNAFEMVSDGSWVGKFKVENEEVWQAIKDKTYKGFSIEGVFTYSTEPKEPSLMESVYRLLTKIK